jgi:transposase
MRIGRSAIEHVFGTIKGWMGATHFLTHGLDNARTEPSLQVLVYNLTRAINLIEIGPLIATIRTT